MPAHDQKRSIYADLDSPFAFSDSDFETSQVRSEASKGQISLVGIFVCTTLFCVIIGLHTFVSPNVSVVLCGSLVIYVVMRMFPCEFGVVGGLLAFFASLCILPVMLGFGGLSPLSGVVLCLAFPSAAYVFGAFYTELVSMDG